MTACTVAPSRERCRQFADVAKMYLGNPATRLFERAVGPRMLDVGDTYNDDVSYARDLGLIAPGKGAKIANPIYREVIVRVLGAGVEDSVADDPRSFVLPDGRLDFDRLLREFAAFWRQHGEILITHTPYREAACQLVAMAYLQRIVNGGGYIEREYGVGTGRVDLLVRWPYRDADGDRTWQREAIELKIWHESSDEPLQEGLAQLDRYLERLGLDSGTLVIFNQRSDAPQWAERTSFTQVGTATGRKVTLLRA